MTAISSEIKSVQTESGLIEYTLERKNVKNINLRIRHDGTVYVSVPSCVPEEEIQDFVKSKGDYIRKAVDSFRTDIEPLAELQFVSGENVTLLGKNLRLSIEKDFFESVFCDGVYVHIRALRLDYKPRIKEQFTEWINDYCMTVFDEVMHEVHKRFIPYGVAFPELRIREMTARWGSCMPKKGVITLNKRLIEAPMYCIEYVVFHEFCHFIHPNHSKDFYSLLQVMLPDWKESKRVLEESVRV